MTEQEFPYLTSLHVNDCHTYRDFDIPIGTGENQPFRHLILTGRNGSGKTTILQAANVLIASFFKLDLHNVHDYEKWKSFVSGTFQDKGENTKINSQEKTVCAFFKAQRQIKSEAVIAPISEVEFKKRSSSDDSLSALFKQYFVNKKVNQVFDIIEQNGKLNKEEDRFFDILEKVFQSVYEEKEMKLVFVREAYEFYLQYPDGRKHTLNRLPNGFSAILSIILELLVRVDMIQNQQKDFSFDPPGIVLIDEPEVHLHLEMQYQVMPLLTSLFPNIQFIVATHSPAVTSSIKDATVFDLTTKEIARDWVVGSSFSELMQTHFGLDNEFSNIADGIMAEAEGISENGKSPQEKLSALQTLLEKNRQYLSPEFHLALESTVIQLEEELESA